MNSLSLSARKVDAETPTTPSHPPISEAPHKLARRHSRPAPPSLHSSIQSMGGSLSTVCSAENLSASANHAHDPRLDALQNVHSEHLNALATSTISTSSSLLSGVPAEPSAGSFPAFSASISPSLSCSPKYTSSSRRSSSTADISPYLTRPAEVPTSGKRLKQLALLELVADESSKMTPVLMNRDLPVVRTRDTLLGRHPGACASVPPPAAYEMPSERYDPTPSRPGARMHYPRSAHIPSPRSPFQYPSTTDTLQVRPQSGQLTRYDVSIAASRDRIGQQNQLLSLLGSHPEVSANGEPYRVPERLGARPSPYFHSSAPSIQHVYPNPFPPYPNAASPTTFPGARAPLTTQTASPPPSRPAPSSTAQLLSILNNGGRGPVSTSYSTPAGASAQAR